MEFDYFKYLNELNLIKELTGENSLEYKQLNGLMLSGVESVDDLFSIFIEVICELSNKINASYEEGFHKGKDEGYEIGLDEGYFTGYNEGKLEGFNDGYSDGYDQGLIDGESNS